MTDKPQTTELLTAQDVIEKIRSSNDVTAVIYLSAFAQQAIARKDQERCDDRQKIIDTAIERGNEEGICAL